MSPQILSKSITFSDQPAVLACDHNCSKAWGRDNRPKVQIDPNNQDDFAYLADSELGEAPEDPGTYEGGAAKPLSDVELLNKWCARACERCVMQEPGTTITLPDFSNRVYNISQR